jgi:hypothetical protein
MNMKELEEALRLATRGMARLQARQEMMECFIRALITESPPAHPLFWKALQTAKSDLNQRADEARAYTPPVADADAMGLWNVLLRACEPPSDDAPQR